MASWGHCARCMALLIAGFMLAQAVHARPSSWTGSHLDKVPTVPAGLTCISHPEVQYGGHPGPAFTDPTWIAKSNLITFVLTNSTGQATTKLCPSLTPNYNLTVSLGGTTTGLFFLTADGAEFATTAAGMVYKDCGASVGSRVYNSDPTSGPYLGKWTIPLRTYCDRLAGNRTTINVRVTYASGQGQQWFTASTKLMVDASCYNATCAGYVAPPPSSPAPPPPPPPAGNGTKPVYPDCIGATLLPNPCPLGKRCFYDTECKPQTSDLTYPSCSNAVPLPNPFPSSKCCFYDSQCKPQCEDMTNSKCVTWKASQPACSTTLTAAGCARCSATNSSACDQCWYGYSLNVATKKCDCLPGYAGTTKCTKCAVNTVSYGGKLPTAACFTCPTGTVPNVNQTECISPGAWDHWGNDLTNRRWGYQESRINVTNVGKLRLAWTFAAGGDVTATPTVVANRLYVPDWGGNLWCLDATTGAVIWQKKIYDLVLLGATKAGEVAPYPNMASKPSMIISRASPIVSGSMLIVGAMKKGGGWPYLLALNIADGTLIWGKRMDPHVDAMVTQSGTVYGGNLYLGISSLEELHAADPTYPCCTFRGSVVKVRLSDGALLWRWYTAPDNKGTTGGFSGNSVWGSSPAVDVGRNQVYIATGNTYEQPDNLTACLTKLGPLTSTNYQQALACEATYGKGNYHNSMVALDMTSGAVRWARQLGGPDAWNGACFSGGSNANCPSPGIMDLNSPDYDFAQAPMLVTACKAGFCKQLVVAGQKSGWVWALSPDSGEVHWDLPAGPGGTVGGLQWGSAADYARVYVANNNYLSTPSDLTAMKSVVNWPATTKQVPPASTDGGIAVAINAYDGTIEWTFANPTPHWEDLGAAVQRRARSQAPMTVANDVVYYSSMDAKGTLFFLDARTGRLLGSFETGQTNGCGASVVGGSLYVGSGYANFGLGQSGNLLHKLTL